jgi:hypothetical protein
MRQCSSRFAAARVPLTRLRLSIPDDNNFYVRARGSIADLEKAFRLQLNDYQVQGQTLRANATNPYIEGPAAAPVQVVSGLDSGRFAHPFWMRPANLVSSTTSISSQAAECRLCMR